MGFPEKNIFIRKNVREAQILQTGKGWQADEIDVGKMSKNTICKNMAKHRPKDDFNLSECFRMFRKFMIVL